MYDIVAPKSDMSARDILKKIIREDDRFRAEPTIDGAVRLADILMDERRLYVRASYLLDVWMEYVKEERGDAE